MQGNDGEQTAILAGFDAALGAGDGLAVQLGEVEADLGGVALGVGGLVGEETNGFGAGAHFAGNGPAQELAPETMMIEVAILVAELIGDGRGDINDAAQADVLPGKEGFLLAAAAGRGGGDEDMGGGLGFGDGGKVVNGKFGARLAPDAFAGQRVIVQLGRHGAAAFGGDKEAEGLGGIAGHAGGGGRDHRAQGLAVEGGGHGGLSGDDDQVAAFFGHIFPEHFLLRGEQLAGADVAEDHHAVFCPSCHVAGKGGRGRSRGRRRSARKGVARRQRACRA